MSPPSEAGGSTGTTPDAKRLLSSAAEIVLLSAQASRPFDSERNGLERQQVRNLFDAKERAEVTLNSIGDAVVCTDVTGRITFFNAVAERVTGWPPEDAAGRPAAEVLRFVDAATREAVLDPMAPAGDPGRTALRLSPCILIRRDGIEVPIEDCVTAIQDRSGRASGAVVVFRDVSAARALALRLEHSAQHDLLTGLPNRLLLDDRIRQAIALAARHRKQSAVLFLDLDGFKHINDSLGHSIGDALLQTIAQRLVACVREVDTVSRQGGDEFLILLSEIARAEDAAITCRRMLQAVADVRSIDHRALRVGASIGVSVYPDDGADAVTLIRNADTAMYQAKSSGRQRYRFFKPAMDLRAAERHRLRESLRGAVGRQEFTLHYQPQVNLWTGAVSRAEALIRWVHPDRGLIPAAEFMPLAEGCGLGRSITDWVLRESCRQTRAWKAAGLPLATVAVHVSPPELHDGTFLERVVEILDETGLDPESLELELTESALMEHAEASATVLGALRKKGVHVAIDNFGTGYSKLSRLGAFSIETLKIDRSFVRGINGSPADASIVVTLICLARNLKMRIVAEGVETREELAFLRTHRCDEAQGHYFSHPVPPLQLAALLERNSRSVAAIGFSGGPDPRPRAD